MGHKLYSVKRRQDFVYGIANIMHNIDGDYEKYTQKIVSMMYNNDRLNITKQLILRPNVVLSVLIKQKDTGSIYYRYLPALCAICQYNDQNDKLFQLFLACLFHFSNVILGEQTNGRYNYNVFLNKYFNFNNCNNAIITFNDFVCFIFLVALYVCFRKFC